MIKIQDRKKHSDQFVTAPGSRFKEEFHGEIQEDGHIELVSDGFKDIYKEIQADAVGASPTELIQRVIAGDPSAMRKDEGFYADIIGMPTTYAEILNTVNDGRRKFDSLPLSVRERFNNNFEEWFATFGKNDWFNKMGFEMKKEEIPVEPIVTESEVKE